MGIRCAYHVTPLYPHKLALTSPTGGGSSVGIVRSRTKATEFSLVYRVNVLVSIYIHSAEQFTGKAINHSLCLFVFLRRICCRGLPQFRNSLPGTKTGRIGCPKTSIKKTTNRRLVKTQDREDINYIRAKALSIAKP